MVIFLAEFLIISLTNLSSSIHLLSFTKFYFRQIDLF